MERPAPIFPVPAETVVVDYTNWLGRRGIRHIAPIPGTFRFGRTRHHKEEQWLFDAWDLDKNGLRTFALSHVHAWLPPKWKDVL